MFDCCCLRCRRAARSSSGLGCLLNAAAEGLLPQYTVPRAEERKRSRLPIPIWTWCFRSASCRKWDASVRFAGRSASSEPPHRSVAKPGPHQAEPGLFSPDEDRPPKPLTGEWAEKAIWQSDYVDTWGTHPATPVPSRTPRYGFRLSDIQVVPVAGEESLDAAAKCAGDKCSKCDKCDACKCAGCPGKQCQGSCETQLEHGETAKVILELMETLGRSVLDGTVFQKPGQADQEWLKELSADGQVSPREALIQYIRHLESQEEQTRARQVVQEEEIEVEFVSHPLLIGRSPCSCPLNDCDCPSTCRDLSRHVPLAPPPAVIVRPPAAIVRPSAPSAAIARKTAVHTLRCMLPVWETIRNPKSKYCGKCPRIWRWPPRSWNAARFIIGRISSARWPATCGRTPAAAAWREPRARRTALYAPQQPHRDVQAQLNELREELHRTRAELEQARGKRPPAASGLATVLTDPLNALAGQPVQGVFHGAKAGRLILSGRAIRLE